jgi:DNA-binding PadR family transcriptional regulator
VIREIEPAAGEMFAVIVHCEKMGWVEIESAGDEQRWIYRLSDQGAKFSEALGLDPMKGETLHAFTLLAARSDESLPQIVSDLALERYWQEEHGRDVHEAISQAKELLG